jgi:hypothetical protein
MLIQLVAQHPQLLAPIVRNTPPWVWGLLAALLALGVSQLQTRRVGAVRMAITPLAMTVMSLWGTASAFAASPLLGQALLAWGAAALLAAGVIGLQRAPTGAHYDAAGRSFRVPGSWLPLAFIVGIFLTKYVVGVDLTMQPALARDGEYALVVATLYGLFSGIFAGRAGRLWRIALRPATVRATATFSA